MSLFGNSSGSYFSYGSDQGIDSSVDRITVVVNSNNQYELRVKLTDGGTRSVVLPFTNQALGSGDNVTFDGCHLTGELDMHGNKIMNLDNPTSAQDAVTKMYVDSLISGLSIKAPVKCATVSAGTLASSFANGQTVDGYVLQTHDRILIKDQADAKENGIYKVNASGAPTRASDADNTPSNELFGGVFCFVEAGSVNIETGWVMTSPNGVANIGVDNILFSQFSTFTYTNGTGLNLTNRQFSANFGSSAGTVCEGNDSRLSNARQCDNTFVNASTARSNLSLGAVALANYPSSGYVKSTGSAFTSSGSVPTTDISGLGALATAGYPTSGYVKSNGSSFASVSTIPASDITGLTAYDESNVAITGGQIQIPTYYSTNGSAGGGSQHFNYMTSGLTRWASGLGWIEGGSNSGSNYHLWRYADDGSYLGNPVFIARNDGAMTLEKSLHILNSGVGSISLNGSGVCTFGSAVTDVNVAGNINGSKYLTVVSPQNIPSYHETTFSSSGNSNVACFMGSSITSGGRTTIELGKSRANLDDGVIGFHYSSSGSANNNLALGLFSSEDVMMVYGNRKVGINTSANTAPWLSPLTIYNAPYASPAIHFTPSVGSIGGGYLYSDRDSQALLSGGGYYASGWLASATSAEIIDLADGSINLFCNTGLTPSSSFSPSGVATFSTSGLSMASGKSISSPSISTNSMTVNDVFTASSNLLALSSGSIMNYTPISTTLNPVGSAHNASIHMAQCRVSMTSPSILSGDGFTVTTGSSSAGSVRLMYTIPFASPPSVILTPSHKHNAGAPMGIGTRVNTTLYESTDGCQVETFNTGTGLAVGTDGTGSSIVLNVMVIGVLQS